MVYGKEPVRNFSFRVHVELSNWQSEKRPGSGVVLCVGAWSVEGKEMKASLEKRDYWTDETGTVKHGKAKGINSRDFEVVLENIDTIAAALGLPRRLVDEKLAARGGVAFDAHLEASQEGIETAEGNLPF